MLKSYRAFYLSSERRKTDPSLRKTLQVIALGNLFRSRLEHPQVRQVINYKAPEIKGLWTIRLSTLSESKYRLPGLLGSWFPKLFLQLL